MGTLLARLSGVDAGYGGRAVLHDLNLDLVAGRQLAVLGPSGAGKSTLLRVLTRELAPLSGTVTFDPAFLNGGPGRGPGPREGVVHQDALLFGWLTVRENIALGLRLKANADADPARVDHLIDLLGLGGVVDRYPDEISGGKAQRTSLARALAISPDLLLLDEPFSALDPATRSELQQWLRAAAVRDRLTSVVVTHDLDEALVLADDIVLVDASGRIARTWVNAAPAPDAAAALLHPLRAELRRAYGDGTPEPDDAEFFGVPVGGGRRG
nr:ATP-binding cassette domain-containing protein [Propionibacterium sp.]